LTIGTSRDASNTGIRQRAVDRAIKSPAFPASLPICREGYQFPGLQNHLRETAVRLDPYKNLPRAVVEAMRRGNKIQAIKLYRVATGDGLKEAKDFIEEVERRAGI
jgi:hypothetical protein